jgi:lipoate-protein ligase A
MANVLRHHFLKEISGAFVDDSLMNDAIIVLKQDKDEDVRMVVADIESEKRDVTLESFLSALAEKNQGHMSDTDSLNSEDETMIENEIRRHNSEDNIDHGPVLSSLR